ncbi:class I SAM-dependent methyltransferase [Acaryochloris sp. IP29b_bin.148]|uniref:class I SAM-dependent methyltransferase n=1 Tax=Acaryochloris sp. IP29b_bin.148 TaxID=2969218 RepID=UPI002638CCA1|nr:class I SAM-dependent methyltransferase [Acaryochloris sp. IP29b_bin.148]
MTTKLKPDWAGEDWLSKLVNLLIQTKPIYAVMKQQARQVLIKTAEKNGVPWRQAYKILESSNVKDHLDPMTDPNLIYPSYYQVPFHAYEQGNLCWPAAFEAESATYAMALRVWPQDDLTWDTAQQRLRASFHQVLADNGPSVVTDVLDMGCSVGISTFTLHRYYQSIQPVSVHTTGLDLSPYMLSVARERDVNREINWLHAKAEDTGLADQSFDLITLQFVIHELPRQITQDIFAESFRLLRPGGCIALVDNNPKSPVIQNLPPALFTLMKSTEPWSDDYYTFDVESALVTAGFKHQTTTASDPRHRTIVGTKPICVIGEEPT